MVDAERARDANEDAPRPRRVRRLRHVERRSRRGAAAVEPGWDHPLTEPWVRPETMNFWRYANRRTAGIAASRTPAANGPHCSPYCWSMKTLEPDRQRPLVVHLEEHARDRELVERADEGDRARPRRARAAPTGARPPRRSAPASRRRRAPTRRAPAGSCRSTPSSARCSPRARRRGRRTGPREVVQPERPGTPRPLQHDEVQRHDEQQGCGNIWMSSKKSIPIRRPRNRNRQKAYAASAPRITVKNAVKAATNIEFRNHGDRRVRLGHLSRIGGGGARAVVARASGRAESSSPP